MRNGTYSARYRSWRMTTPDVASQNDEARRWSEEAQWSWRAETHQRLGIRVQLIFKPPWDLCDAGVSNDNIYNTVSIDG